MADVLARIGLCGDIRAIRTLQANASPARERQARIVGNQRVQSIRRVLLGRPGRTLADDLLSPSIGAAALTAELDKAEAAPTHDKTAIALYAVEAVNLVQTMRRVSQDALGAGLINGSLETIKQRALDMIGRDQSYMTDKVVDHHIDGGKFDEAMRERIAQAMREHDAAKSAAGAAADAVLNADPELAARVEEHKQKLAALYAEYERLREEANAAFKRANDAHGEVNEEDLLAAYKALAEQRHKAMTDYNDFLVGVANPAQSELHRRRVNAERERLNGPYRTIGQEVIDAATNASSVSPEQAKAWAAKQTITTAAKNRLKKMGYPVDAAIADMAEFYRLTNGRITTVKIDSKGQKRANATAIGAHGEMGVINLGSSFDKRVLFHELAHHIEADPVAKAAAGQLIRRRSIDGLAYTLRCLTGNKGYDSNEVAYKDSYFDEYVGKIYRDGATEVFSMGVESFSDPITLGKRMAQDPETLEFVRGFIQTPVSELQRGMMALREAMAAMNGENRAEAADDVAGLQAKLAEKAAPIVDDRDMGWLQGHILEWTVEANKWTQVGRSGQFLIFSGKVRNSSTGRKVTGLVLAWQRDGGWLDTHSYPTKDMNVIKAALGWHAINGVLPRRFQLDDEAALRGVLGL